jgi:hypothetical protein
MFGEQFAASLIVGLKQNFQIDKWGKLLIGTIISGACTFSFAWGSGTLTHLMAGTNVPWSLAAGFAEGLVSSAAIVYFKFSTDPLTKGMSISVPSGLEIEQNKILQKQGITTVQGKK